MTESSTPVTVTVNGRSVTAVAGELLIEVAERAGTYVPRFCYHPRMEPVGVCRMCLVEVDGPRGATLQPACYIRVTDNMSVSTDTAKVKKAQDGVLEFLLANHPLDCPVCDKGGECPLQDQTLAHGSGETRFVEEKRHFVKPIEIGPLVLLDRERCIQCARCTRFSAEVAGDTEIAFAGRGDQIEVAPSPEHPFNSVFSGNTVQICPVGALTATPYRFAARPWDLEQVESTCTQCALGCRVAVQSSGNRLTRVLGVDSEPVNHGWLCDKGRFTLDAVDGNPDATDPLDVRTRVTQPLVREDGRLVETSWSDALARAAALLAPGPLGADGVGVVGGAALTNEGAYAWARLAREVLGTEHVDAQYGDGLDGRLVVSLPRATIDETVAARVILTLAGDPREELPVLFLRVRQGRGRAERHVIEVAAGPSAWHEHASLTFPVRPGEAHRLIEALVSDGRAPADLAVDEAALTRARELLGDGDGVVVVLGRANTAESPAVIEVAARTLHRALPRATFLTALRRSNVLGAIDAGLAPGVGPGRVLTGRPARDTLSQLAAVREGTQGALLVLGSLIDNVLDGPGAESALERARVVVVTGHGGPTLAHADVVLPATVQHERTGTVTNVEGRLSAVAPKVVPPGAAWPDVAIAAELARALGGDLGWSSVPDAAREFEGSTGYPTYRTLIDGTHEGRVAGRDGSPEPRRAIDPMAFPGLRSADSVGLGEFAGDVAVAPSDGAATLAAPRVADLAPPPPVEVPGRDAYGLAVSLSRRLYDHGVAMQGSPALFALVAPTLARLHPADLDRLGLDSGDRLRVRGHAATLEVTVERDGGVPRGVLDLPFGARSDTGESVHDLIDPDAVITQVKVEVA